MNKKSSLIKELELLADKKDIITHRWNRLLTVSNYAININIVIDLEEADAEDQLQEAINRIRGLV